MVFGEDEFAGAFDFDFEDEGFGVINNNDGVVDTVRGVAVKAEVAGDEAFVEERVEQFRNLICSLYPGPFHNSSLSHNGLTVQDTAEY